MNDFADISTRISSQALETRMEIIDLKDRLAEAQGKLKRLSDAEEILGPIARALSIADHDASLVASGDTESN